MGKALTVLKKLERMSEKQFIPLIGPVKGEVISNVLKAHKPVKILEIGTLFGYSSILMASELGEDGRITTIEIREDCAKKALSNIEEAGLSHKIKVVIGNALDIIPGLSDTFDLLFIDAAKEEYFDYLISAEKKLKKGSLVVADNVVIFKSEMLNYLDYIRHSGNYESKTVDVPLEFSKNVPDAMEISAKL